MNKKIKVFSAVSGALILTSLGVCSSNLIKADSSIPTETNEGGANFADIHFLIKADSDGRFIKPLIIREDIPARIIKTIISYASSNEYDSNKEYKSILVDSYSVPVGGSKQSEDDNIVVAQSAQNTTTVILTPELDENELKYLDVNITNSNWTDSSFSKKTVIIIKNKKTHKKSVLEIVDKIKKTNVIWTDISGKQTSNPFSIRENSFAEYKDNKIIITNNYDYYSNRDISEDHKDEYSSELVSSELKKLTSFEDTNTATIGFVINYLKDAEDYNTPPVIDTINPLSNQNFTNKDNIVNISGQTSDEDGDILDVVISIDGKEVQTTKTAEDGSFKSSINTKALTVGKHKLTVAVDDGFNGTATKDIEFEVINNAPSIETNNNKITVRENENASIDVSINDKDIGQTLNISAEITDANGKKTTNALGDVISTGQIINKSLSIPLKDLNLKNNCSVKFIITDGIETITSSDINITILPPKTAPTIDIEDASNNQSVGYSKKGKTLTFSGHYNDINEEDTVTITAKIGDSNIPSKDITVNNDGTYKINVNTASLSIGTHTLTITASDGELSSNTTATITVENSAPSINVENSIGEISQGGKYNLNIETTDENDGQSLTISYAIDDNSEIILDSYESTGVDKKTYTLEANGLELGTHKITIFVSDEAGEKASVDTEFIIVYQPEAPTLQLSSIENSIYTSNNKSFTVSGLCYDRNNDDISLSVYLDNEKVYNEQPLKANDNNEFNINISTETPLSIGTHNIKVIASDGELESIKETSFEITNLAPSISATVEPEYFKDKESVINIPVSISDNNIGQELTISYSLDNNEYEEYQTLVSQGENIITISIPVNKISNGSHTLNIKCSDGIETSIDSKSFKLCFSPQAPVIYSETDYYEFYCFNEQQDINVSVYDVNDDDIDVKLYLDNVQLSSAYYDINPDGLIKVHIPIIKCHPMAENILKIVASDGELSSEKMITLKAINTPPAADIHIHREDGSENPRIKLGEKFTIYFEAIDVDLGQNYTLNYGITNSYGIPTIYSSVTHEKSISLVVDSKNLSLGTNRISLRVNDEYEKAESYIDIEVYKENVPPVLNINPINDQIIESETEPTFNVPITGQASDANDDSFIIKYILYKDNKEIDTGEVLNINGITSNINDINAALTSLKPGNYQIQFIATDFESETIQFYEFKLDWKKIEQEQPIPNPDPDPIPPTPDEPTNSTNCPELYISNIDGTVVNVVASDDDIDEKVNIYCEIDGKSKQKLASFIAKEKPYKYEFDLADYIEPGEHTVVFYAIDADGNYSNEDGDIIFKNNHGNKAKIIIPENNVAPSLYINSAKTVFTEDEPISLPVTVMDTDSGQTIDIFYQVDDLFPVLFTSIGSNSFEQNIDVTIPKMSIGEHKIHIYATDSLGATSKPDNYTSIKSAINNYFNENSLTDIIDIKVEKSPITSIDSEPILTPPPTTEDDKNNKDNNDNPPISTTPNKVATGVESVTSAKKNIATLIGGITATIASVIFISTNKKSKK